jgi:hypothetical protein
MRIGVDETSTVRALHRQIGIESGQMSDTRFHGVREAKEFIASQIAGQAMRDSVPFSEIERKMLLFSQVDGTPPDIMEVADEFDRQYDPTEYEKKVSTLITRLDKRLRKDSPTEYDAWWSAIKYLKRKDHYVNVMIGQSNLRPAWDNLKLIGAAMLCIVGLMCWFFISEKYGIDKHFPKNFGRNIFLIVELTAAALAILSALISYLFYLYKSNRTPHFLNKILTKLFEEGPSAGNN